MDVLRNKRNTYHVDSIHITTSSPLLFRYPNTVEIAEYTMDSFNDVKILIPLVKIVAKQLFTAESIQSLDDYSLVEKMANVTRTHDLDFPRVPIHKLRHPHVKIPTQNSSDSCDMILIRTEFQI